MKGRVLGLVAAAVAMMPGAGVAEMRTTTFPFTQLADAGHAHAPAFGKAGDPRKVTRTIELKMTDRMRIEPGEIRVRRNETVRLVVINAGDVKHEIQLGDRRSILAHLEEMGRTRRWSTTTTTRRPSPPASARRSSGSSPSSAISYTAA